MTRFASAALFVLAALVLTGCSKSADKKMIGDYADPDGKANLSITADKITMSAGPMSLSFAYKVVKTEGNTVTIEVAEGDKSAQETVTVADDHIVFNAGGDMKGRWNRK